MDIAFIATKSWFLEHGWKIVLILFAATLIRRFGEVFVGKLIHRSLKHSDRFENNRDRKLRADTLTSLVGSVLRVVVWIIAALLILSELGTLRALAPFLAGALAVGGVLSLLLGFGIQTFVKDLISGIFIVAENQYRVGDVVSIMSSVGGAVEGTVTRITLRTTVLRDQDGAIHFIPNGNIARAANQTLDYAKINIELTLPFTANFQEAEEYINALGEKMAQEKIFHHKFVQAPYYHGVQKIDEDTVLIEVRAKTVPAEQWKIASALRQQLAGLLHERDSFSSKKRKKT